MNTAYVHRIAKIKQTTKKISMLNIKGSIIIDPNLITAHAVDNFPNLFSSPNCVQDNLIIEDIISCLISDHTNSIISKDSSSGEIIVVVFALNKNSAPGPDGFGALFYQTFWDIVKSDVIAAVNQFFTQNWISLN